MGVQYNGAVTSSSSNTVHRNQPARSRQAAETLGNRFAADDGVTPQQVREEHPFAEATEGDDPHQLIGGPRPGPHDQDRLPRPDADGGGDGRRTETLEQPPRRRRAEGCGDERIDGGQGNRYPQLVRVSIVTLSLPGRSAAASTGPSGPQGTNR